MSSWGLVALGGCLGAISRYVCCLWISKRTSGVLPWGTFFVNMVGSLLLGWLYALGEGTILLLAGTGFLGAFTTFSTFSVEGLQLWNQRKYNVLAWYLTLTYILGLGLAYVGYIGGKGVFG